MQPKNPSEFLSYDTGARIGKHDQEIVLHPDESSLLHGYLPNSSIVKQLQIFSVALDNIQPNANGLFRFLLKLLWVLLYLQKVLFF